MILWPAEMRDDIEVLNELIYHDVNNGVYKSGFRDQCRCL